MLSRRHDELCPGPPEQACPRIRIVLFRGEPLDEIRVAELRVIAKGRPVMLELGGTLQVHMPWIPLVPKRGNGVYAPMDENPELAIDVPVRRLVALQALP